MPAPFAGGCRCGAIRYECSAEPFMAAYCHCRDCQFASGGAYATFIMVPTAAVTVVRGEPVAYQVDAESGSTVTRKFCGTCGTPLFSELGMNPALYVIKAGSLDDASWVQPGMHIWTGSAQPWAIPDDGLPRFEKNPPQ